MNRRLKNSILPLLVLIPLIVIGTLHYLPEEITDSLPVDRSKMKKLNILIWESYIPEDGTEDLRGEEYYIFEQFAREHNIDVVIDYFETNEDLLDQLRQSKGVAQYDLVMPSNFLVHQLAEENLIQKIDQNRLANFSNLDTRILDDASQQELLDYSVPYLFGVAGLAYNSWQITEIPLNWGFLFAPSEKIQTSQKANFNFSLTGKLSFINDMRTALSTAMIYLNEDASKVPEETRVNNAADLLIQSIVDLKTRRQRGDVVDSLLNGKTNLAMAWSGDAMLAMMDSSMARRKLEKETVRELRKGKTLFEDVARDDIPKIRFTCPNPNAIAFFDCFSIVANSTKVEEAEEFINFLLNPTIAAQITNFSAYANAVPSSKAFVNRDILNGPAYFLPDDESVILLGKLSSDSLEIYSNAWARVTAALGEVYPQDK